MTEKSRIRFNPSTREVEIEGSEAFVKAFFHKIQALMTSVPVEAGEASPPAAFLKKAARLTAIPVRGRLQKKNKKTPGTTLFATIVGLIQSSRGITTGELQEKTGLTKKQIWSVTHRAEKTGIIKRAKRGVYEG